MGEARSKRTFHLSSILSVHQRALPPDKGGGGRGQGAGGEEEGGREDSCRMHHSPTPIFSLLRSFPISLRLRKIHFHYLRLGKSKRPMYTRREKKYSEICERYIRKSIISGCSEKALVGQQRSRDKISQSGRERVTARPSTTVWHPGPTQPPQGPRG